jgi:hypothetical protein
MNRNSTRSFWILGFLSSAILITGAAACGHTHGEGATTAPSGASGTAGSATAVGTAGATTPVSGSSSGAGAGPSAGGSAAAGTNSSAGHGSAAGASSSAGRGAAAGRGSSSGAGTGPSGSAGSGTVADADGGAACVAAEGEHCGGNINRPCSCASGLVCMTDPRGPAPGDVGGTCKPAGPAAGACSRDADCKLKANYCTGCDCMALGPGEDLQPCSGPGVRCLADPCGMKTAACENRRCVAR